MIDGIRTTAALLSHGLQEVDDLSQKLVSARWTFEILKRQPELGIARQAGQQSITAEVVLANIQHLEAQRDTAIEAVLYLTGNESTTLEQTRDDTLLLVTALQRTTQLKELLAMMEIFVPLKDEQLDALLGSGLRSQDQAYAALEDATTYLNDIVRRFSMPEPQPRLVLASSDAPTGRFTLK